MNNLKGILFLALLLFGQGLYAQKAFKDTKVALAYEEVKQYKNAIYHFEKAWATQKSMATAKHLVRCHTALRDFNQAYYWQRRVVKRSESLEDHLTMVEILKAKGKYESAREFILKSDTIKTQKQLHQKLISEIDSSIVWTANPNGQVKNLQDINSPFSETSPVEYRQGLVFSSNREGVLIKAKDGKSGLAYFDLYFSGQQGEQFNKPQLFSSSINSVDHEATVNFSSDFKEIYFTRVERTQRDNLYHSDKNRMKLYRAEKEGNKSWSEPKKFMMNDSIYSFGHPFISQDGNLFFFASNMPGGYGGSDLYVCRKLDSIRWSKPINLGPEVNTKENEMYPFFTEKRELFFSSDGHFSMGGYDLYKSELINGEWNTPENLKSPLNSPQDDFSINWIGTNSAYIVSNRAGGKGLEDIYHFSYK